MSERGKRRGGYESSSRRVTELRNPPRNPSPTVSLFSDEVCAIQNSSGAPGRLDRAHFEAIERIIATRLSPIVAALDLADAEAQHVVDDEVYVAVGLVRNALNGPGSPTPPTTEGAGA